MFVVLTPEEWVRQSLLHHMHESLGYPYCCIHLEYLIRVQGMPQRADILVRNRRGENELLVECKAAHIALGRGVLEQVARYNAQVQANYFAATNGVGMAVFSKQEGGYEYIGAELPRWRRA